MSIQIADKYISILNNEKDTLIPAKAALTLSLKSVSLKTVHTTYETCLKIRLVVEPDKNDNRIFKISSIIPDKEISYQAYEKLSINRINSIDLKVYQDHIEGDIIMDGTTPIIPIVPFLRERFLGD